MGRTRGTVVRATGDVRQLIDAADDRRREMPVHDARRRVNFSAKSLPEAVTETRSSPDHTQMKLDCPDGTSTSGDHNMSEPLSSTFPSAPATWSAALLAHQLPPLRSFTGEDIDNGETFQDWIEQFEMVASIGGWDERAKLVNLTTRLRGQAYTFYKSCPDQERRKYTTLVAQLKQRFTPVRLRAVQSSLFHDRKQKFPKETVDAYAQDLRRLFYLAYPQAQQGTEEAEDMGRSVLSYQFVAGLRQEIKVRLAGVEGTFEQLLARARLEEAKLRDLAEQEPRISRKPINPHIADTERGKKESEHMSNRDQFSRGGPRCYHCRGQGHIARNCPMKGRAAPFESQGRGGRHRESN